MASTGRSGRAAATAAAALAALATTSAAAQLVVDGAPDCIVLAIETAFTTADGEFAVEATSSGSRCEIAALLLTIRDPEGRVLWTDSFDANSVFGFEGASQPEEMAAALEAWIAPPPGDARSTADLPPWDVEIDAPIGANGGEFPFFPADWLDGETWEAIRAAELPLFCYPQGLESASCITLDPTGPRVELLGVQTFPG